MADLISLEEHRRATRRASPRRPWLAPALILAGLVAGFLLPAEAVGSTWTFARQVTGIGCSIKGNISIGSGERIYHVPGQQRYDETVIRPSYGERWFCSEAGAQKAGWRRAGR